MTGKDIRDRVRYSQMICYGRPERQEEEEKEKGELNTLQFIMLLDESDA